MISKINHEKVKQSLAFLKQKLNLKQFLDKVEALSRMVTNDFSKGIMRKYRNQYNIEQYIKLADDFLKQSFGTKHQQNFYDTVVSGVLLIKMINQYEGQNLKIGSGKHRVVYSCNWNTINDWLKHNSRETIDMSGIFRDSVPLPVLYQVAALVLDFAKRHTSYKIPPIEQIQPSVFDLTSDDEDHTAVQQFVTDRKQKYSKKEMNKDEINSIIVPISSEAQKETKLSLNRQSINSFCEVVDEEKLKYEKANQRDLIQKTIISQQKSKIEQFEQQIKENQLQSDQLQAKVRDLSQELWLNTGNQTNQRQLSEMRTQLYEKDQQIIYYKQMAQQYESYRNYNFGQIFEYYKAKITLYLQQLESYTMELVRIYEDRFDHVQNVFSTSLQKLEVRFVSIRQDQKQDYEFLQRACEKLSGLKTLDVEEMVEKLNQQNTDIDTQLEWFEVLQQQLKQDKEYQRTIESKISELAGVISNNVRAGAYQSRERYDSPKITSLSAKQRSNNDLQSQDGKYNELLDKYLAVVDQFNESAAEVERLKQKLCLIETENANNRDGYQFYFEEAEAQKKELQKLMAELKMLKTKNDAKDADKPEFQLQMLVGKLKREVEYLTDELSEEQLRNFKAQKNMLRKQAKSEADMEGLRTECAQLILQSIEKGWLASEAEKSDE